MIADRVAAAVRARRLAAVVAVAVLAFAVPEPARAQQVGSVAGQIVDRASNQPLNGAHVTIDGTNRAAISDGRGRFLIPGVPAGTYTIRVQYIGYQTASEEVTVTAGQTAQVRFALEVSAIALNEVVVTGTAGAVERRRLGSSVGSVNVSQVQELVPVATVGQALQARVPGVRSIGTVGGVGASRDLRIRGTSSFLLGQRPVIYIDGVRLDNTAGEWGGMAATTCCSFSGGAGEDRLGDLNPEDIERIEVLKGAAAATLYGAEASNGVIQIFTKRGRSNSRPRFTVATNVGFNRHRANFATKLNPRFRGPDGFRALDPNETLIENGPIVSYDMTVQGGGEDVTYFISGGYSFEEGSVKPNWQKKASLRVNLTWLASQKWSFDLNTSFAKNDILALQSGNNWTALLGNAVLGNPKQATADRPYGEPWVSVNDIREIEAFSNAAR
ncbi:MAG TPA: carboxypeptidase-like regulatory domain-containing protein, partial [Vicinamibacterales bacterium]